MKVTVIHTTDKASWEAVVAVVATRDDLRAGMAGAGAAAGGGVRMIALGGGTIGFGGSGGPRRCSFCGRREGAVEHLVRARGVHICDRCVAQAQEAIASATPGRRLLRIKPVPAHLAAADRDAAEEAIERAYETVFSSEAPVVERCSAIEGGADLTATMQELHDRYAPAQGVDVSVEYVRLLGDDEAEVHFVLFLPGSGASPLGRTGHAVLVGGEWKVSRATWCGLVGLVGVECPPPEG